MLIACKECSKKYQVDTSKIKGIGVKFKCKSCGNIVIAYKPQSEPEVPILDDMLHSSPSSTPPSDPPGTLTMSMDEANPLQKKQEKRKKKKKSSKRIMKIGLIGVRGKLMIFLLVPLLLAVSIGSFFTIKQMVDLGDVITNESTVMLTKVAEKEVLEYTRAVSEQVRLYLLSHPELRKEEFNKDIKFKKIAVQRVRLTMRGYTSLYGVSGNNGSLRNWADINPKLIGMDIKEMKKILGMSHKEFQKIISAGMGGNESTGIYISRDNKGRSRSNYLVCTPVRGTKYIMACTTYLDESTLGVVPLPMSQAFRDYLEMICWPQEKEWWKKHD